MAALAVPILMSSTPNISLAIDPSFTGELDAVAVLATSYFTSFVPALAWLILLLLVSVFVTCMFTSTCGFTLRACRVPANWRQLSQIVLGSVLLFLGFSLAFGVVGINFTGIFFSASVFAAAVIVSASDLTKDFFVGIQLHTFGVLDRHRRIVSEQTGIDGTLRSIGLFTSELVHTSVGPGVVHQTILVPNRILFAGPLTVEWRDPRSKTVTEAAPAAETRFAERREVPAREPSPTPASHERYMTILSSSSPRDMTLGPSSTLQRRLAALTNVV